MIFQVRSLSNMCSAPLDLFTMLERQGSDVSDAMRKMNPPTHLATMKRSATGRKNKEALNPKKMYEEAQMVRRVKAYLNKMTIIEDEDKLLQMSYECEPPPPPPATMSSSNSNSKQLISTNSSASLISQGGKRRTTSPTPSNASTASSTSHQSHTSDGRKSTTSGTKFGN